MNRIVASWLAVVVLVALFVLAGTQGLVWGTGALGMAVGVWLMNALYVTIRELP